MWRNKTKTTSARNPVRLRVVYVVNKNESEEEDDVDAAVCVRVVRERSSCGAASLLPTVADNKRLAVPLILPTARTYTVLN